jgi:hypothetical protein
MTRRCAGDRRRPEAGLCTILGRANHGRSDSHRGALRVVRYGCRATFTRRRDRRPYHNKGHGLRDSTLDGCAKGQLLGLRWSRSSVVALLWGLGVLVIPKTTVGVTLTCQ